MFRPAAKPCLAFLNAAKKMIWLPVFRHRVARGLQHNCWGLQIFKPPNSMLPCFCILYPIVHAFGRKHNTRTKILFWIFSGFPCIFEQNLFFVVGWISQKCSWNCPQKTCQTEGAFHFPKGANLWLTLIVRGTFASNILLLDQFPLPLGSFASNVVILELFIYSRSLLAIWLCNYSS